MNDELLKCKCGWTIASSRLKSLPDSSSIKCPECKSQLRLGDVRPERRFTAKEIQEGLLSNPVIYGVTPPNHAIKLRCLCGYETERPSFNFHARELLICPSCHHGTQLGKWRENARRVQASPDGGTGGCVVWIGLVTIAFSILAGSAAAPVATLIFLPLGLLFVVMGMCVKSIAASNAANAKRDEA